MQCLICKQDMPIVKRVKLADDTEGFVCSPCERRVLMHTFQAAPQAAPISNLTRGLITYWLRGYRKGFGVDLNDYFEDCVDSDEEKLQILKDLVTLSNGEEMPEELHYPAPAPQNGALPPIAL